MTISPLLESQTQANEANAMLAAEFLGRRGLTIEDASLYRLGVVSDDAGLESRPYRGRLSIPYLTRAGVRDIRYRCMKDHNCKENGCMKYLSRANATPLLYNVSALWRAGDEVAICEGEIDAMTMDLYSGVPAVGVPGVHLWKDHFARLFYDFDRVLVVGDGDDAGDEFAKFVCSKLDNAYPVPMPRGMDVNEMLTTMGPQAVEQLAA